MELDPIASTTDLASGTFVERIPAWLRWVLVIPAVIIVPLVFLIIQELITMFYGFATLDSWYFKIMRAVIWGAGIIWTGAYVAPKKQFLVSILLLVISSLFYGFDSVASLAGYGNVSPVEEIISNVISVISGIFVVYSFHKENLG